MNKRVVYLAIWNSELSEMIQFLRDNNYNQDRIDQMEYVLNESTRLDKEPV